MKIGDITINPIQTEPTAKTDPSGVLGELRFIYDATSGIPKIFFKNTSGWYKSTFEEF